MIIIKVAIICEYSGVVRDAFAKLGHEAISFDILPTETPGNHIQGDITEFPLDYWKQFDLAICHPPCTHLAVSGARHFKDKINKNPRIQLDSLDFVRYLMNLPIPRIAIENPVSIISTHIKPPDQIIQPYMFGDEATKTTCLWLKNLPLLKPTKIVGGGKIITFKSGKRMSAWMAESFGDGHKRSKTFQGIANAMAEQWGNADFPIQIDLFDE